MNKEGVPLKDLEKWLEHEEQQRMFLEDEAKNERRLFEWRKKKVVNLLPSLAFTVGLFIAGFCTIAAIKWVDATYTAEQVRHITKEVVGAIGFVAVWFGVWRVTNPLKPHTYFRTPKNKLDN